MKFTAFGIRFEISFLFTAFVSVMLLTDKTGALHYFLAAAVLHEAAHLAVMLSIGQKPRAVRLIPGGVNLEERDIATGSEEAAILLAGPFINLAAGLISSGRFATVNLALGLFNLLPVAGLDGGRLMELIVIKSLGKRTADTFLKINSLLLAAGFTAVFFLLLAKGAENLSLLIFSLYMLSSLFLKKGIERRA